MSRALWLVAVVLIAACGAPPVRDSPPDSVLAYGYVDLSEASSDLIFLKLRQVSLLADYRELEFPIDGGLFYNELLTPGSYQFRAFGHCTYRCWGYRSTPSMRVYNQSFPHDIDGFRIARPGLYFVGTYRYRRIDRAWPRDDGFSLEAIQQPSEREILERLLPKTRGTRWEMEVSRRIAELET